MPTSVGSCSPGRPSRRMTSPTSRSRSRRRCEMATLTAILCSQASAGASCFQPFHALKARRNASWVQSSAAARSLSSPRRVPKTRG